MRELGSARPKTRDSRASQQQPFYHSLVTSTMNFTGNQGSSRGVKCTYAIGARVGWLSAARIKRASTWTASGVANVNTAQRLWNLRIVSRWWCNRNSYYSLYARDLTWAPAIPRGVEWVIVNSGDIRIASMSGSGVVQWEANFSATLNVDVFWSFILWEAFEETWWRDRETFCWCFMNVERNTIRVVDPGFLIGLLMIW